MRNIGRMMAEYALRLLAAGGLALTLAACSKCDVPNWNRDSAPAPQSCHDDAGVK
jgi:hypothetical protein